MFQTLLVNKHYSARDLKSRQKLAERRSASGHRQNEKKKKKPKVNYKPRTPTAARLTRTAFQKSRLLTLSDSEQCEIQTKTPN